MKKPHITLMGTYEDTDEYRWMCVWESQMRRYIGFGKDPVAAYLDMIEYMEDCS